MKAASTRTRSLKAGFPAYRLELEHGGLAWAVVLAGSNDPEDQVLAAAEEVATNAGYLTGPTDCDEGASEAVGGGPYTISAYFDSEADAQQALEAFHADGFEGGAVAQVRTFCLD